MNGFEKSRSSVTRHRRSALADLDHPMAVRTGEPLFGDRGDFVAGVRKEFLATFSQVLVELDEHFQPPIST